MFPLGGRRMERIRNKNIRGTEPVRRLEVKPASPD